MIKLVANKDHSTVVTSMADSAVSESLNVGIT